MREQIVAFYNFINEREKIRLRKVAGSLFPWTEDTILQQYKFTNVRREHDKTTQKLIRLFYSDKGKDSTSDIILYNCALFRYFGTWEFAKAIGWQHSFQPDKIIKLASQRLKNKERVFTGAYIITNQGIKAPKEEVVVNIFLKGVWEHKDEIVKRCAATNSWQETHDMLQNVQGFGGSGFMAKETLLDTMHCDFWKTGLPSDYWEWTPVGPGAKRGINRIRGMDSETPIKPEKMLDIIREITAQQDSLWPVAWGKLAPTDIQFQLCEFDKYLRVKHGEGRPRSRYDNSAKGNVG